MVLNYILLENIIWKKLFIPSNFIYSLYECLIIVIIHQIWIHKYTNYNIIEIYINRLGTTTQIFIGMDYLIMMSEKYLFLEKEKNIFYPPHKSNWIHVLWKYYPNCVITKNMYKNLKWINETLSTVFYVKSLLLVQNILIHIFWRMLVKS